MDEGRAADISYLDFRKAFDIVSLNTFIDKPKKYRLEKWTVTWTENWLDCQTYLQGCDWQPEVQQEASHKWCTPGISTGAGTV